MDSRIKVIQGDITKLAVDAIVNAANSSLLGGGGVDGAIHAAGGPAIMAECEQIGGCAVGKAVITTAGNLPSKHVIHAVGPIWQGGHQAEAARLSAAYRNALQLAVDAGCQTLALPNISTGAYGFPKIESARVSLATIEDFLRHNSQLTQVILCCYDAENFAILSQMVQG